MDNINEIIGWGKEKFDSLTGGYYKKERTFNQLYSSDGKLTYELNKIKTPYYFERRHENTKTLEPPEVQYIEATEKVLKAFQDMNESGCSYYQKFNGKCDMNRVYIKQNDFLGTTDIMSLKKKK